MLNAGKKAENNMATFQFVSFQELRKIFIRYFKDFYKDSHLQNNGFELFVRNEQILG
jgi:hypothetical protein